MSRLALSVLEAAILLSLSIGAATGRASALNLGPEQLVQANSAPIVVPGYSVPSFEDWNNDGLNDLIVGEGGGGLPGKVRIYPNIGSDANPLFSTYFYAKENISDLSCTPEGCLGCFPRLVDWDGDNFKDLLIGLADGTVKVYLKSGSEESPYFGTGKTVTAGPSVAALSVGKRATPAFVDWNNDGMTDLVVGALDGSLRVYYNCGCGGVVPAHFYDTPPEGFFIPAGSGNLVVPSGRSSPVVVDLDGDGKVDILTGNTDGQLLLYRNRAPTPYGRVFDTYELVKSNGVPIDLAGTPRSRPFVCYWTGKKDAYLDVLIGAGDGKIHLYRGGPMPGDLDDDDDIDSADLDLFTLCWLKPAADACTAADLNADGHVDFLDFQVFANAWLTGTK